MSGKVMRAGIVAGAVALVAQGGLAETGFPGARAMGMAGANAVSVRDASAQWYNPAAFGFMHSESNRLDRGNMGGRNWGWNMVDAGAGYAMTGDMGKYLDLFTDIDFGTFDESGVSSTAEGVKSMLSMATTLEGISANDALYVDANIGTGFRIGHWGVGIRMFSEATALIEDVDTANLGISQTAGEFATAIRNAAANAGYTGTGFQTLDGTQYDQLVDKLTAEGVSQADAESAISYVDDQLTQLKASGRLSSADIANAVDFVNTIDFGIAGGAAGSLSNNQTVAFGRAFGVVEVPVSYGHSFFDGSLSVGITAKGMYGAVTGTKIWFFDEDAIDDAVSVVSDNTKGSLNFGLDLGVLYRLPMLQFAVVGHNLNRPRFKGFTDTVDVGGTPRQIVIDDVTLDPQVTLGAAFIPSRRFMLEVNYEALETGTLLDGYNIQRLSVGGELDVWLLALRLGAYSNLAVDNADWVATAGVGLNVLGVRLDVGGAYSLGDAVTYEDNAIPPEARLFASLRLDY